MPVTPAVPYLLLGLQDVQWAVGNSRGARKLARTPHVNQKKKRMTLLHQENIHSPHFLVTHITRHRKKIYLCTNTIIFQHYFFHVSVSPVQFQPTQMIGKGQF
jgi:hypothetical protein